MQHDHDQFDWKDFIRETVLKVLKYPSQSPDFSPTEEVTVEANSK